MILTLKKKHKLRIYNIKNILKYYIKNFIVKGISFLKKVVTIHFIFRCMSPRKVYMQIVE